MNVSVVTPWRDHLELAPAYWEAVEAGWPFETIIVDNGSEPPLEFATSRFPDNRGFCAACNHGLELAAGDAVLFLNNDVTMIRETWLDEIRAQLAPGRIVGNIRDDAHTAVNGDIIPYVDGWCLAAMTDDIRRIGGWDETLREPAYYSDNILCVNARRAGMELVHVDVGLRHLGNQTSCATPDLEMMAHRAIIANRMTYDQAVRADRSVAA